MSRTQTTLTATHTIIRKKTASSLCIIGAPYNINDRGYAHCHETSNVTLKPLTVDTRDVTHIYSPRSTAIVSAGGGLK